MRHREKLRTARRNMSWQEIHDHVSPFLSEWWQDRKQNRAMKLRNKIISAQWRSQANKYNEA